MQRETRSVPADPNELIVRQSETIRALTTEAAGRPNDDDLRERLAQAYARIDVLVRRRDGWSDDGRPPAQSS